jgi:hypothetical protein
MAASLTALTVVLLQQLWGCGLVTTSSMLFTGDPHSRYRETGLLKCQNTSETDH